MSYTVLLPQPILPEGYAYLRERGYEVVDGRGFTEEDILADIADFAAFNEVYAKYFTSKPARSCVAVKDLPKGVLCEIEAVAEA